MENILSWCFLEIVSTLKMEAHGVTSNLIFKISLNAISDLKEDMQCKVKDMAMVSDQEVAICNTY